MDIATLFAKKNLMRLSDAERAKIKALFLPKLSTHADRATLIIEIASLFNQVVGQVEAQFKTRPSEQALTHKFVDCWVLAQGLEDLANGLIMEQSVLALSVIRNQLQRVGVALVEILTLLADAAHCEFVCNLLIELNKAPLPDQKTIDLLQA